MKKALTIALIRKSIKQEVKPSQKSPQECIFCIYSHINPPKASRKSAPILDKNPFAKKLIHKADKMLLTVHIQRSTMAKKGPALGKMLKMMYSVLYKAVGGRGNDPLEDTARFEGTLCVGNSRQWQR